MAKPKPPNRVLTEEEIEILLEDALSGKHLKDSAVTLKFSSRSTMWRWLSANPEINNQLKQARYDSCMFLEDDVLNIHKIEKDPKMARVRLEALLKVLAFRQPNTYSQRIDLNVNNTISIRSNVDSANERLTEVLRDVTPLLPASNT